ncbi:Tripeptidyl aminopeptidase [Drechslerella dactyloides]|uniref:Tripeptidyl aminopeptidase n=1 Tax=Drechslerella dactyloides TaxID=74499 RepID=A0AAD6IZP1_DREDA|nr:Tripeptidyl aminopeptidase [Drechslerella dactyloides]
MQIPASPDLKWYPCNETYQCARLSVPLNPMDPDNGLRSEIPLIKLPASPSCEYKGMVLINAGGPGNLGYTFLITTGKEIANATGPGWDIVGFDPRGMGYSVPNAAVGLLNTTFETSRLNATDFTPEEGTAGKLARRAVRAAGRVVRAARRAIRADHYGVQISNRPDTWIEGFYEIGRQLNGLIQANSDEDNQAVPYMSSPNVAYDMLQIAKADARARGECADEALVNYYGYSYGTIIGQTFLSLYPQHVGRFVLDSVIDMKDWYRGDIYKSAFYHTDENFSTFFTKCFTAGERCSFFTGGSPDAIRDRFNHLVAQFDAPRAIAEDWANSTLVTYGQEVLKTVFGLVGYNTLLNFPLLADALAAVDGWFQAGNVTNENLATIYNKWSPAPSPAAPERAEYGFTVWCLDFNSSFVGSDKPLDASYIDQMREDSVTFGERFILLYAACAWVHAEPKWRFDGPYKLESPTRTPVLFVGLLKDPVAPYENAEIAHGNYAGSGLLYADITGHGIMGQRNWCAYDKVRAYFQNLELPGDDNHCPEATDQPFFYTPASSLRKRSLSIPPYQSNALMPV